MKKFIIKGKPISVNSLYKGRRFLTPLGKKTKEDYAWQIKMQNRGIFEPSSPIYKGSVGVKMTLYFSDRKSDIDNASKALLDSMTGIAYEDDKQITELFLFKKIDKKNPRIEIEVWQILT